MNKFRELYNSDLARYKNKPYAFYERRFHYLKRRCETTKGLINLIYVGLFYLHSFRHQMEIKPQVKCGKGLNISHPYNITINKDVILGDNVNLSKNVTIGSTPRGIKKGVPRIGSNVFIGINATIVGNVKIGDDVLIAPNTYINIDIPDHSIVLGNPCEIHHKDNATEFYVNNRV